MQEENDYKFTGVHWTDLDREDAGPAVVALANRLWQDDSYRRNEANLTMRRFSARGMRGLFQGAYIQLGRDDVRLNLTKAVTETLVAKVGSNRPRPKILTDGANFSLRAKAKKLQKFLDGIYQVADAYKTAVAMFRDAVLFDAGVVHFYADVGAKQVCCERVFPLEILVDSLESINGKPQCMYRVKFVDRRVAKRMFPKFAAEIAEATAAHVEDLPEQEASTTSTDRMIMLVEAWQLAGFTAAGEKVPGKHVIACGKTTLVHDDYNETCFPFSFFYWNPPLRGFWGDPAVTEIRGVEKEVNRLLQHIQKSMKLAGMPWVIKQRGSNVTTDQLTNKIGQVIEYDGPGAPPQIVSFQVAHPQMFEHCWQLYAKAFAILGTNEMQASALKPPGIDSGRGLEQLSEEHLVRFKHVSKAFEDVVGREWAEHFVRQARILDEALPGGFELRARDNKTQIKLKWSECAIGDDDFFLQVWPTSVLPITPSGKTEEVERWQANGWITPERAQDLLDFPDLESERNLATADCELLDWQLERMLDDGTDVAPEPRQNLQYAVQRATYALEFGLRDNVPTGHLDSLRNFLQACQDLLTAAAPPPAQPGLAPTGGPLAAPGMPGPGAPGGGLPAAPGAPAGIAPPTPGTMLQ